MSKQISFDVENAKELQVSLGEFYKTLWQEWKMLEVQWGNLKQVWKDGQFEKFEPLFNQLFHTYIQAIEECEAYCEFLRQQIQMAENRKVKLEEIDSKIHAGMQPFIPLVGGETIKPVRDATQLNYIFRPLTLHIQDQNLSDSYSLGNGINTKTPIPKKNKAFIRHLLSQIVPAKTLVSIVIVLPAVVSLIGSGDISCQTLKELSGYRYNCPISQVNEQNSLNSCLKPYLDSHLPETDQYKLLPGLVRLMPLNEQLSEAYTQDKEKRQREIEESMRFSNPESQWESPYPNS